MSSEQYQQIGALYYTALELAPAARADFLAKECAGDGELHCEVESLLRAHGQQAQTTVSFQSLTMACWSLIRRQTGSVNKRPWLTAAVKQSTRWSAWTMCA